VGDFAVVGSAAFLASSMKMPVTAIVLTLELTRVSHDFLFPMSLAVVGSIFVFRLCPDRDAQLAWRRQHDDAALGSTARQRKKTTATRPNKGKR
jgi:H+/Cl- antiporter ClcA